MRVAHMTPNSGPDLNFTSGLGYLGSVIQRDEECYMTECAKRKIYKSYYPVIPGDVSSRFHIIITHNWCGQTGPKKQNDNY
jgi:hypothetical protein